MMNEIRIHDDEGFDKLYKQNNKLIIPNSIKFNKPEQIHISGGGKLKFDDLTLR